MCMRRLKTAQALAQRAKIISTCAARRANAADGGQREIIQHHALEAARVIQAKAHWHRLLNEAEWGP